MAYSVKFSPAATRQLGKLEAGVRARLIRAAGALGDNPFPPAAKKLRGESGYRLRVGDYRIVYDVHHRELVILVIRVAHRREVYR